MKRQLFNDWIAALRSGKYHQAHGTLRDNNGGYCCLGVLCNVAGLEEIEHYGDDDEVIDVEFVYQTTDTVSIGTECLPTAFAMDLGIEEAGNQIGVDPNSSKDEGRKLALAYMNDHGKTFAEIADILEQNPLAYIKSLED